MAFRTQKISQMTPKGADLEATDLIEVSTLESGSYVTRSITGQEIIDAAVGNVDWGDIGGTLSDQTDLNTALSGKVPTTRTLTINGTTQDLSADRTFTISTGITIGTTAITSGTVGRVLFEGTGNVVQESSSFTYDDTLKVFTITGTIGSVLQHTALSNYNGLGGFQLNVSGGTERGFLKLNPTTGEVRIGATGSGYFPTFYAQGVEAMRIFASTRNIGVNTTTDAGFKLDVNGTARVNTLTIGLGTGQVATNTVLGFQALNANTTGIQNVAIGYQSVFSNTTGSGNVAIGVSSLVFNSTGSGNTAFGDEALLRNTTGGKNIAIGQRAGTYAGGGTANNQTSSDSIYIGYQARASASGATNELVFGKDTVGSGSNTATLGNTSIVDTILRGRINLQQYATGSRPTYVKGALIYDSTLSKLVVGGASDWEVVTSL